MIKKLIFTVALSLLICPAVTAATVSTNGKKKTLIEGFHGEKCGYAPRMIAAEQHIAKKYGDDVVFATFLVPAFSSLFSANAGVFNDWTNTIYAVSACPTTFFDRNPERVDVVPTLTYWQSQFDLIEANRLTDAIDFSLTAGSYDSNVRITAEFGQDVVNAEKYRITYLALVDGLRIRQTNYYTKANFNFEGEEIIPELEKFLEGMDYVDIDVDHIVVANSDFLGLPIESTSMEYTLTIPAIGSQFNGLRAVAIITDNDGNYINALSVAAEERKSITEITLDKRNGFNAYIGENHQFKATVTPADYTEDETLVWSSSNEDVAMVNESGLVSFKGIGQATITVASSKNPAISASCVVTVLAPRITAIRIFEPDDEIDAGTVRQLQAEVDGVAGWENYDSVEWTSSDESIATVDNDGMLTAIREGIVYITARAKAHPDETSNTIRVSIRRSPNSVTVPTRKLYRNTNVILPLQLTNASGILGMQCDITLSEGIEFATDDAGQCNVALNSNRTSAHSVALNLQDSRHMRLLVSSVNNAVIEAGEGDFLMIPLHVADDAANEVSLTVSTISVSDLNFNSITVVDFGQEFTVESYTVGDLNGDNIIDVADVTATVAVIMGNNSDNLTPEASDFNGDGITDISDIVAIIDHILSVPSRVKKNAPAQIEEPTGDESSETALDFATDTQFNRNAEVEFKLRLTNVPAAIAGQFDIVLPESFEFVSDGSELAINLCGETAATHQLTASKVDDKTARVLIFSLSNAVFAPANDFFSLSVKVSDNAGEREDVVLSNIKFISDSREEIKADSSLLTVYEADESGIVTPTVDETVTISGHHIAVSGLTDTVPVMLYSISGMVIDNAVPADGQVSFDAARGVYILKTATKAYRIAIR